MTPDSTSAPTGDDGAGRARPRGPRRIARRVHRLRVRVARALRPVRRGLARLHVRPGPASEIHTTWSESPAHSLTVCWASRSPANPGVVEIRPAGGGPWARTEASRSTRPGRFGSLHRAVVRGLEPGCAYAYRVSCDPGWESDWSPVQSVATAPIDPAVAFETVFFSDVGLAGRSDGTCATTAAVVEALTRAAPLFVLGGGDYAYADRDDRFADPGDAIGAWMQQMQPLLAGAPFMAQLGNHEVELGERLDDWRPRLPDRDGASGRLSYSFDVGAAHFVGLHAPGRAPSAADVAWLEADLSSPTARAATWRIVFQHSPIIAHGSSHPARPELRALMPLFERLGVDLHLSAHDQCYERTHALRSDGRLTLPLRSPDRPVSWASYAKEKGVVYAKVSPAGKLSDRGRGFSRLPDRVPPEIAAHGDRAHHWARLSIDRSALRVTVEGLAHAGDDVSVVDAFQLLAEPGDARPPDPPVRVGPTSAASTVEPTAEST